MKRFIDVRKVFMGVFIFCGSYGFAQTSPLNIGTLPPNKSIVIVYEVVVNSGTSVRNQAQISGGNFTTFGSNDPKTAAPNDSTITQVTSGPLPAMLTSIKAYQQNNHIAVEWRVVSELGIKQYDVEKSLDARSFATVSSSLARGNNNLSINYNWLDVNAAAGNHYYRIKSIGLGSETKYSAVVKVVIGNAKPGFSVYPNPIVSNAINLQFINQPKGIYTVRVLNASGQTVLQKQITHQAGSSTEPIELPGSLSKGNLMLQVTGPGKTKQSIKIIK